MPIAANYAVWDPATQGASLTLSKGNLVCTVTGAGNGSVRSSIGVSSGKWYWETTVTTYGNIVVGVAYSTLSSSQTPSSDPNAWAYYGDGNLWHNSSSSAYGATYTTGDVIGYALDMGAGTLTCYKNGVSQGVLVSGLSGTVYAADGGYAANGVNTTNFGASAFAYSVPSGFNAGLYVPTTPVSSCEFDVCMSLLGWF
jgi:hypothetical protein